METINRAGLVAVSLSIATLVPVHAAAGYDRAQAERYITTCERAWSSGNPNELALVERIIADDFVWLNDGKVQSKRDAIAGAKQPKGTSSEHFDYVHVRFFGDTAIAQGGQTVTRANGTKIQNSFMDTWMFRGGKWQIVAATDIDVKQ